MFFSGSVGSGGSWRGLVARGVAALGLVLATALGTAGPAFALCGGTCEPGPYPPPRLLYLPDLTIAVAAAPNPVAANGALTYALTIRNIGRAPAYGVVVRDTLPAGVAYQAASGSGGFTCGASGGGVACSGGALPIGGSANLTIAARAPGVGGTITNSAVVNPDSTIRESSYANNSVSVSTTVNAPPPAPTVDLTIDLAGATTGSQITYTMHVRNLGTTTATNVRASWVLSDTEWFQGSYSGDSGFTCYVPAEYMDQRVECIGASIAPGAVATITVTTPLPPTAGSPYTVWATVDLYGQIPETNENNNTATIYIY